jgi:Xaa-Pro aminopeptidase
MAASGGENPGITMPVLSGKKANCGHALASRRKMQSGEIIFVDVCGVYKRYHMNAARTFSLGKPEADIMDIANRVEEAAALLRATIRPNLPVKELNQTMLNYYQANNLWDSRGWLGGYEMGIAFPPDWVGNFVYDLQAEKNTDKVFEAGTAVNYEHQFFLPRHAGMLFQVDSILYTEQDASIQSKLPDGLTVIE